MLKTLVVEFVDSFTSRAHRPGTPGKQYNYLYTGSKEVAAGDFAVVHNGTEYGVVSVLRVKPGIEDRVTKNVLEVITKADMERYIEANKNIDEHRRLFDQLDHMLKEQSKLDQYQKLAETNPMARELLDKIRNFSNMLPAPSAPADVVEQEGLTGGNA